MKLLRPREAADLLGVSVQTLRTMDKRGDLTCVRLPVGYYRRYRSDEIARIMGVDEKDLDIEEMRK